MAQRYDQDTTDDYRSPWLDDPNQAGGSVSAVPAPTPAIFTPDPSSNPSAPAPAPVNMSPAPTQGSGYQQDLGPAAQTSYDQGTAAGQDMSWMQQPGAVSDQYLAGGTPGASAGNGFSSSASSYQTLLANMRAAADPAALSVSRDALARQLQSDLEADGHTVTWKGDTLLIDGRPYEVGGSSSWQPLSVSAPAGAAPGAADFDPNTNNAGVQWAPGADHPSTTFPGWQWDSAQGRYVPAAPAAGAAAAGPASGLSWIDDTLNEVQSTDDKDQWYRYIQADPKAMAGDQSAIAYWKDRIRRGDGSALVKNGTLQKFQDNSASGGRGGSQTLNYAMPDIPAWLKNWSPSAPTYDPGAIDTNVDDLPGFDEIYRLANGNDESEKDTEALVRGILEHPESLSDRDVEMLKSKNAEEAAVAAQQQDEELQHFGANTGLDTSPWLAGQRAQNAWNRRDATIGSNRTVDIAAANTRSSDRARAATLGTSYNQYRSSKAQAVTNLAVEGALQKAAEQRGRVSLNEALKQAATQLGLSRDSLVVNYIQGNMDFVTKQMGFDVDLKKLSEQSNEFKQQLAQRIAEVKQADDQFQANYGLAVQQFQRGVNNDAWEHAKSAAGVGA